MDQCWVRNWDDSIGDSGDSAVVSYFVGFDSSEGNCQRVPSLVPTSLPTEARRLPSVSITAASIYLASFVYHTTNEKL
jgi:hypothetical protein